MSIGQLLVLYLMAGTGVAAASYLSLVEPRPGRRWFQVVTSLFFWPLYLPVLLSSRTEREPPSRAGLPPTPGVQADELAQAVARVDAQLEAALQGLHAGADNLLTRESGRLREVRSAWAAQIERIRALDRILANPEWELLRASASDQVFAESAQKSQQAIGANREILERLREQTLHELLENLGRVRELVSMIHVASFGGAARGGGGIDNADRGGRELANDAKRRTGLPRLCSHFVKWVALARRPGTWFEPGEARIETESWGRNAFCCSSLSYFGNFTKSNPEISHNFAG